MLERLYDLGIVRSKVAQDLEQLIQKAEDHLNESAADPA
jgi:hypothetical protein